MFGLIARSLFGTRNDRTLKRLNARVAEINAFEPAISTLDDADLAAKTVEFRQRLSDGVTLDQLLPEAFAVVREAAKRVLGERHYDVQLLGGIVLHEGKIPEMRTGEGKTLVSTAPVYLNALSGRGVHVVTVNDYLAKRDAEWMGRVYRFLGLTVGVIQSGSYDDDAKRTAYACDITYSTNNELGFDYLRDNMKYRTDDRVQRPFHYAVIDEVDSILIDEARTPLIISGPAEDSGDMYRRVNDLIPQLADDDFELDEKGKNVLLTDKGTETIEQLLRDVGMLTEGNLYDAHNMPLVHHVNMALRAHKSYRRDKDYIVQNGKIVLIDEFTGRMMQGRRLSDGLHQAIEAKEKVEIQRENQTLASITFQNFFRMYPKVAGMTGTAMTEAGEFSEIYNLDVIEVPTHRPVARKDMHDEIYRSEKEKNAAIVSLVREAHAKQQPILVGTTSIEKSEQLSELFKKERIPHAVLNARHHEQEAQIVAQAGRPGMVTVATNMAGRGTDIKLGGNFELLLQQALKGDETPEQADKIKHDLREQIEQDKDIVKNAGGLLMIGSERHESRRIDNQLRGRSGRQGDPGASKFYISLQDDLMRVFGAEKIDAVLQRLGIKEGQAIVHPWINTAIERAQKKVEGHHFDIRRNLLRFDNVMNDQRKVVYDQRRQFMSSDTLSDTVAEIIEEVVLLAIENRLPANTYKEQWDLTNLQKDLLDLTGADFPVNDWAQQDGVGEQELADKILEAVNAHWAKKQQDFITNMQVPGMSEMNENFAMTMFTEMERSVVLQMLDKAWKEHLLNLDHLRLGINLRGYAQRDPLNEYKAEAFALFTAMLDDYRFDVAKTLLNLDVTMAPELETILRATPKMPADMQLTRNDPATPDLAPMNAAPVAQMPRTLVAVDKTSRNDPCPCGSGKKYKHCCGAVAARG